MLLVHVHFVIKWHEIIFLFNFQWFLDHMAESDWWPQQILIRCPNQMVRQVCTNLQSDRCVQIYSQTGVYKFTIRQVWTNLQFDRCVPIYKETGVYIFPVRQVCTNLQSEHIYNQTGVYKFAVNKFTIRQVCTNLQSDRCVQIYCQIGVYTISSSGRLIQISIQYFRQVI
jgi:hypothetical protein